MEMGTGKTRTALEFIKYRENRIKKVIWLCPCSVKNNLKLDIKKHSNAGVENIEEYTNAFIIIAGIESISQSDNIYLKLNNIIKNTPDCFIIVDESHLIKNPYSKRYKRIINWREHSKYRMIMTGTPITKDMQDLYTQFTFLSEKILGYTSFEQFSKIHIKYSEKIPGMIIQILNKEYITLKISPYIFQITKNECLNLLPKNYESKYYEISDKTKKIYEETKKMLLETINSDNFEGNTIFKFFGYLHRISCGNFKDFITYERGKILYETVNENKNKKIIVFYKYNSDIKIVKKFIKNCYLINGYVHNKKRSIILNNFKKSKRKILLLNIASGSYGLNLQFADCLIYFENTFDYAKRRQSEDRIYRIGQEKEVKIIDIIANTGIDNKIICNLKTKGYIAKDLRKKIKDAQFNKKMQKKLMEEIKNEW